MKHLSALAMLCATAAAHAGVPVTGGPISAAMFAAAAAAAESAGAAAAHGGIKNEAVRVLPGGKRMVEEPPGPKARPKLPTLPSQWSTLKAHSYVIDTSSGLKECGWPWVAEGCRDYQPGRERRERSWVLKYGGRWVKCPHRDSTTGCVDYYQPGKGAVQE